METVYHNPVLLQQSVNGLNINPSGIYVDVTFGGGGHSKAILAKLNPNGRLLAFDTDPDAQQNILQDTRFELIPENFRFIKRFLKLKGITKVDGILADLGVSSHQFDQANRGFSTRYEGQLDMRMQPVNQLSAWEVVNQYSDKQLSDVLFQYGEVAQSFKIAKHILSKRTDKPIQTTEDLKQVLQPFLIRGKENKILAQVFQAIRIEVNQELEVLKDFLNQVPELLHSGGRLAVISYHSLEDRLVKRFIRNGMFEGEPERDLYGNFSVPMKKIGNHIEPDKDEITSNNRARSAKLRIAEKI